MSVLTVPSDHRPARALLARVADSLFWMARYIERAEQVARSLRITTNLLTDVGDLAADVQDRHWLGVLGLTQGSLDDQTPDLRGEVCRMLTFDESYDGSIIACLNRARENARAVRSDISAEMWETINQLYWHVRSDETRQRCEEAPEEFYQSIIAASSLFQGHTDQTLMHGQRWMFIQLGKGLERVDMTCRILESRLNTFEDVENQLETPIRNIQWMSTLRMCCSIEAYRRKYMGDFDPARVVSYVLIEPAFPRSIRFNVEAARDAIEGIRRMTKPEHLDPTERILGRLASQLAYADEDEIDATGLSNYLRKVRFDASSAAMALQETYFLK
jgi:uncharacterized alpha-E superfamily protein